jgi:hypothetical protein
MVKPAGPKRNECVWVLELAILNEALTKINRWEIWRTYETRKQAFESRERERGSGKLVLSNAFLRVRKYVPEGI